MDRVEPIDNFPASAPYWALWARNGCFWFLVAILAWAPFPLGSNREWSWSILTLLVAVCWLLWAIWAWAMPGPQWINLKRLAIPIALVGLTLVWAIIQTLPIVPSDWIHPIWQVTTSIFQRSVSGAISLNPWATLSEASKLSTYVAVAWMAFTLTQKSDRARLMLNIIIAIGTAYALYAFAIGLLGIQQFGLFYAMQGPGLSLSGPFVQRNSFATFEGLAAVASLARLVESAHGKILAQRGMRRLALTSLQFTFGSGAPIIIATVLTVSALVASASRGGSLSTLCAIIAMAIPFAAFEKRTENRRWALIGMGAVIFLLVVLFWISGNSLAGRFADLIDGGNKDEVRTALWAATGRMISNSPLLGLGLGSFQDAYPMYAAQIFPYIMDKAHNDFLEFAAGVGLPAAFCWWGAMLWSAGKMTRGIFTRRKDRIYSLVGLAATVLIAVHSSMDFSLQSPAVALLYAALLGTGLAQSFATLKTNA